MKKISAVLLVLVLVGSVAFAGFTGYARTGLGYDLDTDVYGFIRKTTSATISLSLHEFVGEAKSEGDIYVDIKAVLGFNFSNADETTVHSTDELDVDLSFKHAKIVGPDWYVGILDAIRPANFATSAIDTAEYERIKNIAAGQQLLVPGQNDLGYEFDPVDYAADLAPRYYVVRNKGVEVGLKGYTFGFGLEGDATAGTETYSAYGAVITPEYELGDGLKAKFGVSGIMTDTNNAASGSVKVSYASDDLSASVAADLIYDDSFLADVAVNAVYDILTFDAYYATEEAYVNTDDAKEYKTGKDNLLSARVKVALDPMTITFTAADIMNDKDLSASVKYQLTDELAVTGRGGYVIDTEAWNGGADVEYKTADYTAKVGGTYRSTERISLSASVESTTLIPGATVKLAYAGDDVTEAITGAVPGDYDNGLKGKVYAEVKIAF